MNHLGSSITIGGREGVRGAGVEDERVRGRRGRVGGEGAEGGRQRGRPHGAILVEAGGRRGAGLLRLRGHTL